MKEFNFIDYLLSISLFKEFDTKDLTLILNDKYLVQKYGRNEIIYLQNEKAFTMDIILDGDVAVQSIDENGNILSIVSLSQGDMLGGNLIFSNKNEYPMTLISKNNTTLLRMEKDIVLELCQTNKGFLEDLLEILSDKALILTTKIHSLAMKTIREKLMDFLTFESNRQNTKKIKLSLSKKELAEKFGVERPSLQRELKKMKDEGLIDYDARIIELK